MLDAIIFDVDGVLLDTVDVKGEAFVDALEGYPDRRAQILDLHYRNGGMAREEKLARILIDVYEQDADPIEVDRLVEKFTQCVVPRVLAAPEIAGATSALASLACYAPVHALSATPTVELHSILDARGWGEHFRSIHGSPPTKDLVMEAILQDFGYECSRCVMVGDSSQDRDAAQRNGVPFVYVTDSAMESAPGDLFTIPNLIALPSLLLTSSRTSS